MLNTLRNKTAGIAVKALLALIVVSFAVWGVEDVFRMRTSNALATVGDVEIGPEAFRERFNRELQRAGARFGRPLTPADARAIGIDRQVLGDLMTEATLQQQAKRMKLSLPQAALVDSVMADPAFQGPGGKFDPNRFDRVLRDNNLNEPLYLDLQRRLMLRRQIVDGLAGGVDTPDVLTQAVFRHQNERRSASYVVLPGSDGADIAAPADDVLKSFFEERKGTFQAPEMRSVTLVAATADALAAKETVSDDDVQTRFEQDKAKYGSPERRTVERITFPSPAEAKEAFDKIKAGTRFEDIAAARNISSDDMKLGTVAKSEILDKPIAEAAFSLPQGQVSEPVEGQFATVLLRVTAIEPGTKKTLDEVKDTVRTEIARQRAEDKILTLHDQIEDDRASGMTLAEVADKNGLEVKTVENVDRQGRAGKEPANIPGGATVLSEVFESDVGLENDPVQIDGGYVWFEVTKVDPARERTFEESRDDVLARWRAEEARKALDAKASEALDALQKGSLTLADLAAREGVQVRTAEKIDRGGGDLGSSVAAQIFSTPKDKFGSSPSQDDGRVLFQVTAIEAPQLDPASKEAKDLAERIAATLENDLGVQYVQQLQSDFGAQVNMQALANALGVQSEPQ